MKKLKILFAFVLLSFTYSCTVDEEVDNSPTTILSILESSSNYSYLTYALQKTSLDTSFNGSNANDQYTLFAPNNMAFSRFLADAGFNTIDDVPLEILKKVLLNHVVVDVIRYRDFETGYFKTAAQYIMEIPWETYQFTLSRWTWELH